MIVNIMILRKPRTQAQAQAHESEDDVHNTSTSRTTIFHLVLVLISSENVMLGARPSLSKH